MSHNYGGGDPIREQQEQWPQWSQEDDLDKLDLRTPGRSPSHYSNSPGEGVGQGERYAQQEESEEDESEEDESELDEDDLDEDGPVLSQHGTPEHVSPSMQPDAPQSAMQAPQIRVSEYGQSSTQPDMSENFQQASVYGMRGSSNSPGYDPNLPEERPYETPSNFRPGPSQLDVSAQSSPAASGQPFGLGQFSPPPQGTGHLWLSPPPNLFLPPGVNFGSTPYGQPSQSPSPSGGSADSGSPAAHHTSRLSPPEPGDGGTPLPFRPAGASSSGGSGERSSPRYRFDVSPHPPSVQGSMVAHGSHSSSDSESDRSSAYDGGSVAVEASPNVQAPTPAPGLPQHMEYGGTGRQKRARESPSTPSSTGNVRPQRKHRYITEERGYGSPGPSDPQGIRQTQQPPMQDINRDQSLLGISHFGPGGQVQSQGKGSAYSDPDPRRRADAAENERIRNAYANQEMPESRPNLAAGFRDVAPGLYAIGAGPRYAPRPQGESSVQGASHSQPNPAQRPHAHSSRVGGSGRGAGQPRDQAMQNVGPGEASLPMGGTRRRNAPQPQSQGESSGQGAGHFQPSPMQPFMVPPNTGSAGGAPAPQQQDAGGARHQFQRQPGPTRDMDANALWSFMNADGPQSSLKLHWRGPVFDLMNEEKTHFWLDSQQYELNVIVASFENWLEVAALGQRTPGQRSPDACANKARLTIRPWHPSEDADVQALTSPDPRERLRIVERLHGQLGRTPDEIVGRFIFFRRSPALSNLGNGANRGITARAPKK